MHAVTKAVVGFWILLLDGDSGHFHGPLSRASFILFACPLYVPGTMVAWGQSLPHGVIFSPGRLLSEVSCFQHNH